MPAMLMILQPWNDEAGLQETTSLIAEHALVAGLEINTKKSQVMFVSKHHVQQPYPKDCTLNIVTNNTQLEQVSHFCHLGQTISCNGSLDKEIDVRIGKAAGAFNTLNPIWHNSNISLSTKSKIYYASVLSQLPYGAASWPTSQKHYHRLEVFQQSCLRKIRRIRYFHHISNNEVLQRMNIQPVCEAVRKIRMRFFGHVGRASCLIDDLNQMNNTMDMSIQHGQELAQDHVGWRILLRSIDRDFEQSCPNG